MELPSVLNFVTEVFFFFFNIKVCIMLQWKREVNKSSCRVLYGEPSWKSNIISNILPFQKIYVLNQRMQKPLDSLKIAIITIAGCYYS